MKKFRKIILFLILLGIFIYLLIKPKSYSFNKNNNNNNNNNNKINRLKQLENYEIKQSFFLNKTYTPLKTEEIDFIVNPKCLCHKEYIRVKLENGFYKVYIKNFDETYSYSYNISKPKFESLTLTCDLYTQLRNGPNQKIISYSFQNYEQSSNIFLNRLDETINFVKKNYKTWRIRVYHDKSLDEAIICEKQCLRDKYNKLYDVIDFCDIKQIPFGIVNVVDFEYTLPTVWRWFPVADDFVDRFVSRDLTSCLLFREIEAVKEWIKSKSFLHVMRDHPKHDQEIPAGLWGLYIKKDRQTSKSIFSAITDQYLNDFLRYFEHSEEIILKKYVWPVLKRKSYLSHDSYHCDKYNGISFPTKRVYDCYVGSEICCNEDSVKFMNQSQLPQCPVSCRPLNYQNEWLYC